MMCNFFLIQFNSIQIYFYNAKSQQQAIYIVR